MSLNTAVLLEVDNTMISIHVIVWLILVEAMSCYMSSRYSFTTFKSRLSVSNVDNSAQLSCLTPEEIGIRWKIQTFGRGRNIIRKELNCIDQTFYSEIIKISLTRKQGDSLGLDLIETRSNVVNENIVLISEIIPNSIADVSGGFRIGDAFVSISGENTDQSVNLEGLTFDSTVNELSKFSNSNVINVRVKRLFKRKDINVSVIGPNDENAGNFTVLSGYSMNLRQLLQEKSFKLYDDRQTRFDSAYQRGNCGGEGTCGTCIVAVMQGVDLLDNKLLIEENALANFPPNYRWACRVKVGTNPTIGGRIKIKLRPQTKNW